MRGGEISDLSKDRSFDMSRRTVYRVFNDSALLTGGRFYGGCWQNIPKEYRTYLNVNGKRMVELDYSNLHPTILYAMEGLTPPIDSYRIKVPNARYSSTATASQMRSSVKLCFNALINSTTKLRSPPRGIDTALFGITWTYLKETILDCHRPIGKHFFTGKGLELQRLDSDIAEHVMLHFMERRIPVLPLHDSFLVHHGYEDELASVMSKAYSKLIQGFVSIDKKDSLAKPEIIEGVLTYPTDRRQEPDYEEDLEFLLSNSWIIRNEAFKHINRNTDV
jgi:hypothetical protein